jgi:hypothetical protein
MVDKKLDEKKSCRLTDRAGSAQHPEILCLRTETNKFVCLGAARGISHGIKMSGSRWQEIKELFGITINHLREFFVQNDPILSSIVKGKPICYADLVDGQGLAIDSKLNFGEPQIPFIPSERNDNAKDLIARRNFQFHPDKHRKHMGMVYFQKGESSVEKLIQVHFSL